MSRAQYLKDLEHKTAASVKVINELLEELHAAREEIQALRRHEYSKAQDETLSTHPG